MQYSSNETDGGALAFGQAGRLSCCPLVV
jgi:hypothetical protein